MIVTSLIYIAIIGPLSAWMQGKKGYPSKTVGIIHNFLMAAYSLYAFIGTASVFWNNWSARNYAIKPLVCDNESQDILKDMDYWVYTFYLSKFVEWFDTISLIVMRGKPQFPPTDSQQFLHVFHHTVTGSIVWVTWRYRMSTSLTGPLTNSIVHVFMYSYYMLTDIYPPIRRFAVFITPIQLIQFVFCLFLSICEIAFLFLDPASCKADWHPIAWCFFGYAIFLHLFVILFNEKKKLSRQHRPSTTPALTSDTPKKTD